MQSNCNHNFKNSEYKVHKQLRVEIHDYSSILENDPKNLNDE